MKQLFVQRFADSRVLKGSRDERLEAALEGLFESVRRSLRFSERGCSGPRVTIGGWESENAGFPLRAGVELTYGMVDPCTAVACAEVGQPYPLHLPYRDLPVIPPRPACDPVALARVQAALDAGLVSLSGGRLVESGA